ncbi:MAG: arsenical-resistance protein [Thermoplasmata archaeon HGW-Thermoplasmata-1]|nr:MAG: arsenical-resistance protein [Thermoplasmata archaeon HGW-Thermoplasmata-1]
MEKGRATENIEQLEIAKERNLGFFEKYLTLWVALCIGAGILLGRLLPGIGDALGAFEYYNVSIPIAICLFFMMYPIMVNIDFREVVKAGKTPKPVALTLVVNWGIKPFTMAFIAWLFMKHVWAPFIPGDAATQYIAGMILLGVAPCTAMVLVWSYLAKGNMGHTLVMVAINSLTMLFLYGPLAGLLLGVGGIPVPWKTMLLSVAIYVGLPLIAGYFSRRLIIKRKGFEWFDARFSPKLKYVSITALLFTLVVLFSLQGGVIIEQPEIIGMIALPLCIQTTLIFGISYAAARLLNLPYGDAAPSAMIGASNHFEVAIAVATVLFGINSGAALATVVGVLVEVPVMLSLVYICKSTKNWFAIKNISEKTAHSDT